MSNPDSIHKLVQDAYAQVAREQGNCCGASPAKSSCCDKSAYVVPDNPVPDSELGLSCGNPLAFGHIREGDIVLDLGSGAGKDVFLAAQKVGASGRVIGVDMTPEMLHLARRNAVKFFETTSLLNVEFREGMIENLPVEDSCVDVVISNCVINLSPDKPQVFREVYRVLKKGGRMLVSDIVLNRPLSQAARDDAGLYASCIAGALLRGEYLDAIRSAGFADIEVLSESLREVPQRGGAFAGATPAEDVAAAASSVTIKAVK
jgi:ubiquinone/menaquinone biosynthesis C-methylase UbiE